MATISDILQETLDLIGKTDDTNAKITTTSSSFVPLPGAYSIIAPQPISTLGDNKSDAPKTASSMLLEQRQKLKRKMEEIDSLEMPTKKEKQEFVYTTPLLGQIASSEVGIVPKHLAKHGAKQQQPQPNKAKSDKVNKGESYHDRLSNKVNMKLQKMKMKNKLKGK